MLLLLVADVSLNPDPTTPNLYFGRLNACSMRSAKVSNDGHFIYENRTESIC